MEFIFLGVLLLVPVTYLIISASQLQAASFAAVGAADHAARTFASADNEGEGAACARNAVDVAVGNLDVDASSATMKYRCSPACLEPGSTVSVEVVIRVPLPFLPAGVDLDFGRASSSSTIEWIGLAEMPLRPATTVVSPADRPTGRPAGVPCHSSDASTRLQKMGNR